MKPKKSLLLAVTDIAFDKDVLKYALNLSKRVNVDIEILYLTNTSLRLPELESFMEEAKAQGVGCKMTKMVGCMRSVILVFTESRRDIMLVVVGSMEELDVECRTEDRVLASAWKRLGCPLVVVSRGESPSIA